MKIFFFLLLSFSSLLPLTASSYYTGNVFTDPDDPGPAGIFSIPIEIHFDGTVGFGFTTTETAQTTEGQGQNDTVSGEKISWFFSPAILVSINKDKVLVNLSQSSLNKSISLEGANKEAGYLVLERSGFDIGIGGGAFFKPVSGLTLGFGLVPSGGSMLYAERFASNLEAAENMPKMKFPTDSKSLDSWKENDVLIYTKKGGISFFGSGGAYGASVGVGYSVLGTWKVFLKKVSSGKIMATVSKMTLNSFSMHTGATITSLSLTKFGSRDKSFAYEFDLESKMGQKGFEEFLSGNFKFTERMAKEGIIEGVTALSESKNHSTGRVLGVNVGIPFIGGLNFEKGMIQGFTETHTLKNNQKIENTMAVYSRSVETIGVASKKMRNIVLFSANHLEVVGENSSFITANFKWMFSQEKSKIKDIEDRVLELKRITGLWNTLKFNFPQEQKLDYSKFEFDTMISSKGFEKLMAEGLKNNSALIAKEKIEDFFQQEEVPLKACKFFKKINNCKNHLLKTTSKSLRKMSEKLEKMKTFIQQKNWKSFTLAYAELGKEAITNQFTFQAFMEMIGKENLKMEFKVSGEKLSPLRLNSFESDVAFQ